MAKANISPITAARVIVTCPGRNFVTLKIETADGSYGLGDATLNGRELAVASYLTDHVVPMLIGRDAQQIEHTWQFLYRGAYWRRGPVTMSAIAAVDTALWDLKAKAAGMPLYQLLGGACRTGVRVDVQVRRLGPGQYRQLHADFRSGRNRLSPRARGDPRFVAADGGGHTRSPSDLGSAAAGEPKSDRLLTPDRWSGWLAAMSAGTS